MDPARLLLSVTAVLSTIDQIQATFNTASNTLFSLRSQIGLLETGLQQIQEWQYFTDPTSKAQVMHSLHAAIETVTRCIQKLHDDLDSAMQFGSGVDTLDSKAQFRLSDTRLARHLTDSRECVSLIHFTLCVCQLPVGREAQREVDELDIGAKALARAHNSYGRGRQSVIKWHMLEQDRDRSANYNTFVSSITEMEKDLPEDSGSDRPPTRESPTGTNGRTAYNHGQDLPEHYLQDEGNSPPSAEAYNRFSWQAGPARPPKILRSPSASSSESLRRYLFRKPVRQTSVSSQSTVGGAPSRQFSVSAQSVLSEATLEPSSPATERGTGMFGHLRPHISTRRATAPSNTNALFGQVTRSLSSLAEDLANVGMEGTYESPPPYVNSPASPVSRDVKRRDTQSTLGAGAETADIIQVVRDNQTERLLAMLEQGVGIDELDPITKRTAVMEATLLRRTNLAQILIRSGSRLHLKDIDGSTALHFAAVNGDANTCVLLLDAGAQLEDYNRQGETPLDLAARGGHTETVIVLLNTWTLQGGHATSLMKGFLEASQSGNASTAQAFIERGIKPKKIKESWKPIAYAAQSGSNAMIDLMIVHKCSLKDRSPDGWTALHFAASSGQTAMVEKLLLWKISWKAQTKKLQETALHLAILAGHTSTAIALVLHKDANISMKDADDHQAIHHAVRNGDIQLAALLLNKGAKLDAQTKYGWTPMHIAAAYGHLPLVAELITRGANIEEKLETPSFKPNKKTNEAARKGYWCEIRWPHAGARPLHLALEFGQDEAANILIASGAKVDEADSKDWRPLHYASWNCRPQMVELLLNKGTSSQSTTADGNTPLSLGFREPGLTATYEDKERICGILNAAMYAHKKSKLKQLTGFMNAGSNRSRDATERNKAWHMAELAAALYQSGQLGEGDTESDSHLTPTVSSQYNGYAYEYDEGNYDVQPESSRIEKMD